MQVMYTKAVNLLFFFALCNMPTVPGKTWKLMLKVEAALQTYFKPEKQIKEPQSILFCFLCDKMTVNELF